MATRVPPYHSDDQDVYHVYKECSVGNNIERDNKKSGTGGKRLCKRCIMISSGEVSR
jgi:hypothetical protein